MVAIQHVAQQLQETIGAAQEGTDGSDWLLLLLSVLPGTSGSLSPLPNEQPSTLDAHYCSRMNRTLSANRHFFFARHPAVPAADHCCASSLSAACRQPHSPTYDCAMHSPLRVLLLEHSWWEESGVWINNIALRKSNQSHIHADAVISLPLIHSGGHDSWGVQAMLLDYFRSEAWCCPMLQVWVVCSQGS